MAHFDRCRSNWLQFRFIKSSPTVSLVLLHTVVILFRLVFFFSFVSNFTMNDVLVKGRWISFYGCDLHTRLFFYCFVRACDYLFPELHFSCRITQLFACGKKVDELIFVHHKKREIYKKKKNTREITFKNRNMLIASLWPILLFSGVSGCIFPSIASLPFPSLSPTNCGWCVLSIFSIYFIHSSTRFPFLFFSPVTSRSSLSLLLYLYFLCLCPPAYSINWNRRTIP